MKRIVILSDTHGNYDAIDKIKGIMKESDYVFHLGDHKRDMRFYEKDLGEKLFSLYGNCDGGGEDIITEVEGKKIFLTHGDRYGVKHSLYKLQLRAKEVGADIVCFGHSHKALIEEIEGITYINPGCMTRFSDNSYCYLVINGDKTVAKTVYLY